MTTPYPIGTTGTPWNDLDKTLWLEQQTIHRSFFDDVEIKLEALKHHFNVEQYGSLHYQTEYPLYALRSQEWDNALPTILITGGVHGYETSGVHGALAFAELAPSRFVGQFNFIIVPCVSPWGYETINRWNPKAIDPNRSFKKGPSDLDNVAEESYLLMEYLAKLDNKILAHFDLHETTDTDNSEFRPALFARDGITDGCCWDIPDGFYLVGNKQQPCDAFQTAIIQAVEKVTHIAPSDENGNIIGEQTTQAGVINYDVKTLGLCAGVTEAEFTTTTEVYPDSPEVTPANCIEAQIAAVIGGLDYLLQRA